MLDPNVFSCSTPIEDVNAHFDQGTPLHPPCPGVLPLFFGHGEDLGQDQSWRHLTHGTNHDSQLFGETALIQAVNCMEDITTITHMMTFRAASPRVIVEKLRGEVQRVCSREVRKILLREVPDSGEDRG